MYGVLVAQHGKRLRWIPFPSRPSAALAAARLVSRGLTAYTVLTMKGTASCATESR